MSKIKINFKGLKIFWINAKGGFCLLYKKIIRNQDVQTVVLVILVSLNTLFIQKLLTSKNKSGCFFSCPAIIRAEEAATADIIEEDAGLVPRLLDGILVEPQASSSRVLALVVENHFEARPQAGIAQANLIYEVLTEGGITRFLALFEALAPVETIGPVRSCRKYFLDIVSEYEALFGHVGGSPGCLDALKRRAYDAYDLNQYFKDSYFWRDRNNQPPHNVFSSSKFLNQYLIDSGIDQAHRFEPWSYKDAKLTGEFKPAEEITIDYSVNAYKVDWVYNQKKNDYLRYTADEPHKDKDGTEVRVKNIVVQYAKTWLLDSLGRLGMKLEGRGEALVFLDGRVIEGYWKKEKQGERTHFYNNSNEEIKMNRGATWVEIVPTDRVARYK